MLKPSLNPSSYSPTQIQAQVSSAQRLGVEPKQRSAKLTAGDPCLVPTFLIGCPTTLFTVFSSGYFFMKEILPRIKNQTNKLASKLNLQQMSLNKPRWLKFPKLKLPQKETV